MFGGFRGGVPEVPRLPRLDALLAPTTQDGLALVYAALPRSTFGLVLRSVVTLACGELVLVASSSVGAESGATLD